MHEKSIDIKDEKEVYFLGESSKRWKKCKRRKQSRYNGFALLFVGIWNIYWAIRRFTISKVVMSRAVGIPTVFEQHLGMIILFIFINLFFGGVIGVIGCFFDLYVRSQVLKSRSIFEQK